MENIGPRSYTEGVCIPAQAKSVGKKRGREIAVKDLSLDLI